MHKNNKLIVALTFLFLFFSVPVFAGTNTASLEVSHVYAVDGQGLPAPKYTLACLMQDIHYLGEKIAVNYNVAPQQQIAQATFLSIPVTLHPMGEQESYGFISDGVGKLSEQNIVRIVFYASKHSLVANKASIVLANSDSSPYQCVLDTSYMEKAIPLH